MDQLKKDVPDLLNKHAAEKTNLMTHLAGTKDATEQHKALNQFFTEVVKTNIDYKELNPSREAARNA